MARRPPTPERPRSTPYVLLLLAGIALGVFSAVAGTIAGLALSVSGLLGFRGSPLPRSVAGYLLGGEAVSDARKRWLAIVDVLVGILVAAIAVAVPQRGDTTTVSANNSPPPGAAAVESQTCPAGLLPSILTRDSLESFLAKRSLRSSTGPGDGPQVQIRAFADAEWTWSFYFDRASPTSCPPRCINLGNVERGKLGEVVSDVLGRDAEIEDAFKDAVLDARVPGGHVVPVEVDVASTDPTIREVVLGVCQ